METTGDALDVPPAATWFLSAGSMRPTYDGVSTLRIPQQSAWIPNMESNGNSSNPSVNLQSGHEHAFVCIFTMPATGMMTFGMANENVGFGGPSQRYFRVNGLNRQIHLTQNATWGAPPSALGPIADQLIKTDVPQGLMMRISDAASRNVTLYYQDGGSKDPTDGLVWTEITGIPKSHEFMTMGLNPVFLVVGHPPSSDDPSEEFLLDYIALIQDPGAVALPPPNDVDLNWTLY